jgi:hypothetical protein
VFEEMPPFNEEQCAMLQKLEDKSAAAAVDANTGGLSARKRKPASALKVSQINTVKLFN